MIALRGDAAEVALGEAQAVLALVQDGERRGRLADLVAAVQDGELGDDEAQALEELIELGLTSGFQPFDKRYFERPAGREMAQQMAAQAKGRSAQPKARQHHADILVDGITPIQEGERRRPTAAQPVEFGDDLLEDEFLVVRLFRGGPAEDADQLHQQVVGEAGLLACGKQRTVDGAGRVTDTCLDGKLFNR